MNNIKWKVLTDNFIKLPRIWNNNGRCAQFKIKEHNETKDLYIVMETIAGMPVTIKTTQGQEMLILQSDDRVKKQYLFSKMNYQFNNTYTIKSNDSYLIDYNCKRNGSIQFQNNMTFNSKMHQRKGNVKETSI